MEIIKKGNLYILQADEGYKLKSKEDVYTPKTIGENGEVIEAHIPYYFEKAYIPKNMTLEQVQNIYDEIIESETNVNEESVD